MVSLVKRYSNRRLYDTGKSRYITIEELARRLRAGEDFKVVDAKSGQDLTKRTLLQVILLESMDLVDVLPLSFLKTLIRLRDGTIRDLFIRHLRMNMEMFAAAQKQIEENLRLVQEQMTATTQLMRSVLPFGKTEVRAPAGHPPGGDVPEPDADHLEPDPGSTVPEATQDRPEGVPPTVSPSPDQREAPRTRRRRRRLPVRRRRR